jgi:SAM-dependent methyltransferase
VHGIGFIIAGARSYTGVDPRIDHASERVKDLTTGGYVGFGWTGAEIERRLPRIRLVSGRVEDLPDDALFDVAVLHNVTEHLHDLESVLAAAAGHLRPDGELVYQHHNYYAWNGHHMAPKRVSDIDADDPEQRQVLDWAHIDFQPPPEHYISRGLNRLRLHEVRAMTERHYDIAHWDLIPSDAERGAGRLTDAIAQRYPALEAIELTTQYAFCRAHPKRPSGAGKDRSATAAA